MATSTVLTKARGAPRGSSRIRLTDVPPEPLEPLARPARTITKRQSACGAFNSHNESVCPGYKKVSCFAIAPDINTKNAMKSTVPLMDCNDLDSLPPAIRRKYCSSLERLRYAQPSSTPKKPSGHFRNLSSASGKFMGSKTRGRSSSDSFRNQASSTNLRKLSRSDARWFAELPDELPETVQRKHFSREERVLLANKRDSAISDVGSLCRRSVDSDIQRAREEVRKSFRWMEDDSDFNIQLQLHKFSEQESRRPPPSRHALKRTLSLTSRSRRTHTSSSSCTVRSRQSLGNRRTNPVSPLVLTQRGTHSADSEATYYQDPEARLKLRVYLASPQKFDEAVEFGFPSQAEPGDFFKPHTKAPAVREMHLEEVGLGTELGDSTLAHPTDDYGDASGRTETAEIGHENTVKPLPVRSSGSGSSTDHGQKFPPGMREMTLRMTLTRKDLRAYEEEASGCKELPLTSEGLPPENDQCARRIDWAAIDRESESGLKRLWRKVKRH